MVTLTAYFDAAGHPDGKKVLVVGGYVAHVNAWIKFEGRWNRSLARFGLSEMHLTDFISNGGRYRNWKGQDGDKHKLVRRLSTIIADTARKSVCESVYLDDWRKVDQVFQLTESHCTPYALASYFVVHHTMTWWLNRDKDTQIRFVFEDGDKHKGDFMWLMDRIIRPHVRELRSVTPHFESRKIPPLQASDFVAWANRRAVQVKLGDDSLRLDEYLAEAFRPLVGPRNLNRWGWFEEKDILKFCVDYDLPKRSENRVWSGPLG